MSTTANCPFCQLDNRIIASNDLAILFLSDPKRTKGHFLISPKRHIEQPWLMSDQELHSVFELIKQAQEFILRNIAAGCDVRQNYRPFQPQSKTKVDHVHYHVLPRDLFDDLYEKVEKHETALFKKLSENEFVALRQKFLNEQGQ